MADLQELKGTGLVPMVVAICQLPKATIAVGVLTASILAYLVLAIWQWHRLSHIPGPFWAAFSKGWMVKESLKGSQPTAFKEMNDKYGLLDYKYYRGTD